MPRSEWTFATTLIALAIAIVGVVLVVSVGRDPRGAGGGDRKEGDGAPSAALVELPPAGILSDLGRWDVASPAERRRASEGVEARLDGFRLLRLHRFSSGGRTHEVAVYSHSATGIELSLVPGGAFLMGSPEDEPDRYAGERYPHNETRHPVTLTAAFLLARTPVTQKVWSEVMGRNPSAFRHPDHPVESVTFEEAWRFCRRTGLVLPTEAQWARACRAGTAGRFSFGDDEIEIEDHGWHEGNSAGRTHPVGRKLPNAMGLLDLHGNVWEWCADWFGPFDGRLALDPVGPPGGTLRVLRGGCFSFAAHRSRSAARGWGEPAGRFDRVGFRPARPLPDW